MFRSTYTMKINGEHVSAVLAILDMTEINKVKLETEAFSDHCEITFKASKKEAKKVVERINKYVGEAFMT